MAEKWTINEKCTVNVIYTYIMDGNRKIARVYGGYLDSTENSAIISAAPDLVEAIKPFVEWINRFEEKWTAGTDRPLLDSLDTDETLIDSNITIGDLRRARAAYLKAIGGSNG